MLTLVISCLLTLVIVSLAVGTKLLLLARRTRAFPELALGLFFLVGAGLGYPLSAAAPLAGEWAPWVAALSSFFSAFSAGMLYAFTARVFHPGQRAASVGFAVGLVLCALYAIGYSHSQITASTDQELVRGTMIWGGVSLVMAAGSYGWTGWASLRQYALHRRRLALGLADPVVTNRMLLFGLMATATVVVVVVDGCLLFSGSVFAREILIPLVTSSGGLLFGALLTLAFFPPASYLRAVRRRDPVAQAGA
jgi:hypothetical protein